VVPKFGSCADPIPEVQLQFPFALRTREMVATLIKRKFNITAYRQFRRPVVGADRHHLPEAIASRDRTR
jgi:hypothetical protein